MCRYCAPIDEGNYLEDLFTDVYGDHIHGAVMNENDALIDLDTIDTRKSNNTRFCHSNSRGYY